TRAGRWPRPQARAVSGWRRPDTIVSAASACPPRATCAARARSRWPGRPWRGAMGERRVAPVEHGGAPRGWLDFSANLNPCGVPAGVRAAVASARYDTYADLSQESATRRLARASGIRSDHAVLTAGATEGLRLAAALLEPGDRALVIGPTYGEYARLARSRGALVEELRASAPSFRVPARELLRRIATDAPRLVFLCDPNNPTGARVAPVALTALVDVLPRRT